MWTFSNGYSEIYINNEAKTVYEIITGSRPTYIDDSTEALKLGNAGAVFLDGRLDNVAFYGKVLTAAEVDWLYDNTCPTNCLAY